MPRRDPRRNISRITPADSARRTAGWIVRLTRKGETSSRFFSDGKFGGKMKSLAAAKSFRDSSETDHWNVEELSAWPSQRNVSGVVGVRRARHRVVAGGKESRYAFWVAQWTDGHGHRKTRSFSVKRYGENTAYAMAMAARIEGVRRASR